MKTEKTPKVSCIITAYSEGYLASVAIQSLLGQTLQDIEILIVDDGASEETRSVIRSYEDDRIHHIRQSNDGPSSARNRAIHSARGEYVCFLDADDSRPSWALSEMVRVGDETGADVVFSVGLLSELRNETLPFYDTEIFQNLAALPPDAFKMGNDYFTQSLRCLAAVEPQSANKLIRRDFLNDRKLRFPATISFAEDMIFHNALILGLRSFAIVDLPCFTYFRRYGRPQITSSNGINRFDAIEAANYTLKLFASSAYFQDTALRAVVLAATFKLLKWCEESVSHSLRWHYRQSLLALVDQIDSRYRHLPQGAPLSSAYNVAPWVQPSLNYFESLR